MRPIPAIILTLELIVVRVVCVLTIAMRSYE